MNTVLVCVFLAGVLCAWFIVSKLFPPDSATRRARDAARRVRVIKARDARTKAVVRKWGAS